MRSSKYLIAGGVVNYTEGLGKYYADEERKRREHYERLRQRDQRELEVAKLESPLGVIKDLAQLSSTIAKVVKQQEAAAQAKKAEDLDKWTNLLATHPGAAKDLADYKKSYDGKRSAFDADEPAWQKFKRDQIAKGRIDFVRVAESVNAKQEVILMEAVAEEEGVRIRSPEAFNKYLASKEISAKDLKKYNEAGEGSDYREQVKLNWRKRELEGLDLSDELISKVIIGDLKRKQSSERGTARALASAKYDQVRKAKTQAIFGQKANSLTASMLPQAFKDATLARVGNFTDIKEGDKVVKTAFSQAADSVLADFMEININSHVPQLALTEIEDFKFPHPAGKNGEANIIEAFFKKDSEVFNKIIAGNKIGSSKYLQVQTRLDLAELAQARVDKFAGKDVSKRLNRLQSRGLVPVKDINEVRNVNIEQQTPEVFAARDAALEKLDREGRLPDLATLKATESNTDIIEKWAPIINERKAWKDDNKKIYNLKLLDEEVYRYRTGQGLEKGGSITTDDGLVVELLSDFKEARLSYYLSEQRRTGTINPGIAVQIENDLDDYKARNGWGTKNGPGLFSLKDKPIHQKTKSQFIIKRKTKYQIKRKDIKQLKVYSVTNKC